MAKNSFFAQSALIVGAAIAFSTTAQAGLLIGSVTPETDGSFTYEYTIDNSAGTIPGVDEVFGFSLDLNFTAFESDFIWDTTDFGGDITVPSFDWVAVEGPASPSGGSFLDFFAFFPTFVDLGETLGGFSFNSFIAPGTVDYAVLGFDSEMFGTVAAPFVETAAVPEPHEIGFIGFASIGLMLFIRKRIRRKATAES